MKPLSVTNPHRKLADRLADPALIAGALSLADYLTAELDRDLTCASSPRRLLNKLLDWAAIHRTPPNLFPAAPLPPLPRKHTSVAVHTKQTNVCRDCFSTLIEHGRDGQRHCLLCGENWIAATPIE